MIERQAPYFAKANLAPETLAHLNAELEWVRTLPTTPAPPITLVGTDTHPGNFLIDAEGKAWFVDLEKATDGLPAIDLAHATLYTSTTWDPDVAAVLSPAETASFYETWSQNAPPAIVEVHPPLVHPGPPPDMAAHPVLDGPLESRRLHDPQRRSRPPDPHPRPSPHSRLLRPRHHRQSPRNPLILHQSSPLAP